MTHIVEMFSLAFNMVVDHKLLTRVSDGPIQVLSGYLYVVNVGGTYGLQEREYLLAVLDTLL